MKKFISFALLFIALFTAFEAQAQHTQIVATSRNGTPITATIDINPRDVIYVTKSPVVVFVKDVQSPYNIVKYGTSTPFDTLSKYLNKNVKTAVKVNVISPLAKRAGDSIGQVRDTAITYLYNVAQLNELRSYSVPRLPQVKSIIYFSYPNQKKPIQLYLRETPAILNTRIDSLFAN